MSLSRLCLLASALLLIVWVNLLVWTQDFFHVLTLSVLVGAFLFLLGFVATLFSEGRRLTRSIRQRTLSAHTVGGIHAVLRAAFFLGTGIVIFAIARGFPIEYDLTREGRLELSPQSQQVLRSMTKRVSVLCFFINSDDRLVQIARQKTIRFLDLCRKYTDLLDIEMLDPQIDRSRLEELKITYASAQGTVVLRCGTRQRVITLSGGSPRLEERDFINALVNVLRDTEPNVYFLAGHGECDPLDEDERTGSSIFHNLLTGESYKVQRYTLSPSHPEIPGDCSVLVIANPKSDFLPQEVDALDAYLARGGRLLLLLDPWRKVQTKGLGREVLRPWLEERLGIRVGDDVIIGEGVENPLEVELRTDREPFTQVDEDPYAFRGCYNAMHPITRLFDQVMVMRVCRTVRPMAPMPEGVTADVLLRTPPNFWAEMDVATAAQTKSAKRSESEPLEPQPLAVAAVKRIEQQNPQKPVFARAVVIGDSDLAANEKIRVPGNLNFLLNTVAWLTESEDLIAIRPRAKEDPPIVLSSRQQSAILWVSTLLTLQGVLLTGLIVSLRRRRAQ